MKTSLLILAALLAVVVAHKHGYAKGLRDGAEGVALFFVQRARERRRKAAQPIS